MALTGHTTPLFDHSRYFGLRDSLNEGFFRAVCIPVILAALVMIIARPETVEPDE